MFSLMIALTNHCQYITNVECDVCGRVHPL